MGINISAVGTGLAAIFGAGAVLLAALGKDNWGTFAVLALIALVLSILLRKIRG